MPYWLVLNILAICGLALGTGPGWGAHRRLPEEAEGRRRESPGNLANAADYVLEPDVLEFLLGLGKPFIDFSTEVIPHYINRIFTFHNPMYNEDIGSVERWQRAQFLYPGKPPAPMPNDSWRQLLTKHPEVKPILATLLPGDISLL